MKKVLIITYYWPKSGGAGVQRWLKFAKFLPQFGIEPIVLTVDPEFATYPQIDESLEHEIAPELMVYRTRSMELYSVYRSISKKKEVPYGGFANEGHEGLGQKMAKFIRGNLFLPDPRRGWNRFAYAKAIELIRVHHIDTVITTSPPHSTQLVGLKLKKNLNIRWIADLRDPWTDIYYYNQFKHTKLALAIDKGYERQVVRCADELITVSEDLKRIFATKAIETIESKIHVIPNGYDAEDFEREASVQEPKRVITYTGTISEAYDIDGFTRALKSLDKSTKAQILLRFVGKVPESIAQKLRETGVELELVGYVPHAEAIDYMMRSTFLLLVIPKVANNKGIVTGKFFEYLASGKRVLAIAPTDGDLAQLIAETNCGKLFDYENEAEMVQYLELNLHSEPQESQNKKAYSRKALTERLAQIVKKE